MIKLIIIDDHTLVLKGIVSMLTDVDNIKICGTFSLGQDLLDYLKKEKPEVLLLDINLPDINGMELCKIITKSYPYIKIIGLTNYSETGFIKSLMKNGAKGYLLKNTSKDELITAINKVSSGEIFLPTVLKNQLLNESFGIKTQKFIPKLTRREREVLECIAGELTNSETAEKLFISVKTVESHRNNLLQKFAVRNTAGLIKEAYFKGVLS